MGSGPWYMAAWKVVDSSLSRWSRKLQRIVRLLRIARALLVIGVLVALASAGLAVAAALGKVRVETFLWAYAAATLFLVIPLVLCTLLVGLPLRARSIVRLIDQGYPANARELAIRMLARKLHDESIATEELLWDTAVNEGRKWMRKAQAARDGTPDDAAAPPRDGPDRNL